ncbi:hypothetical protein L1887_17959 [Cichorium endivia]|nr:hypothetical protein L1887_17959 [Cichorium endivia]
MEIERVTTTASSNQALAGVNPMNMELLKEFPILSKLDPSAYGPVESTLTEEVITEELNEMSVEEIGVHDIAIRTR